jgi:hypothetical protein
MTVKELMNELAKLDPNKELYLSDNELDNDTYYYQLTGIVTTEVWEDGNVNEIITLTHRR